MRGPSAARHASRLLNHHFELCSSALPIRPGKLPASSRPCMPHAASSSSGENAALLLSSAVDSMPSDVAGSASLKREARTGDSLALATLILGLGLFFGATWWIVVYENWSSLGSPFSFHPSGQSLGIALLVIGTLRCSRLLVDEPRTIC